MPDWPILPYRPLAQPSLFSRLGWHILASRPSLDKQRQKPSASPTRPSWSDEPRLPSPSPSPSPIRTSLLEAFPPPPDRPLSLFALPGLRRRSRPRHERREDRDAAEPAAVAWNNPHPFLPPDHPFLPSAQPPSEGHGSPAHETAHPHIVDLEAESPTRLVQFDYGPRGTLRPRMSSGTGSDERPFSDAKAMRIARSRTRQLAVGRGSDRSSSSGGDSSVASSEFLSPSLRSAPSWSEGSDPHLPYHGWIPSEAPFPRPDHGRSRAILQLLYYLVGPFTQSSSDDACPNEQLKSLVIALRRLREAQALLERLRRRLYTDNFSAMAELAALGLPGSAQSERERHLDSWWTAHSVLLSEVHFALGAQRASLEALLDHRAAQMGKAGRALRKRWGRVVGLSKAQRAELTTVLYHPPLDQMKTVQTVWKLEEEDAMPSGTFARYKAKRQTQSLSALDEEVPPPSAGRHRRWSLTPDERAEAALLGVRAVDIDRALSREREGWRVQRRSALLPKRPTDRFIAGTGRNMPPLGRRTRRRLFRVERRRLPRGAAESGEGENSVCPVFRFVPGWTYELGAAPQTSPLRREENTEQPC